MAQSSTAVRVSLRDVAAKCGVSHVTVSLALRGDTRISQKRREEIRAVAECLGYRPDPMLASLAAYRQTKQPVGIRSTIGWINQWTDPRALRSFKEFDSYWRGAEECAEHLGYRLEAFVVGEEMREQRLQQVLLARNVRGLLIPPHSGNLVLPQFDWTPFSLVRLGVSVTEPRAHIVISDQKDSAEMAFEKIFEKGYRRITYISSLPFERNTGGNFRAGYLCAQDRLVPLRRHLAPLYLGEAGTEENRRLFNRWRKTARPDAILTSLGGLRRILSDEGVRVPEDVAVAALSMLDGHFDSGVDQNSLEIGRVAMATLAGLIHQNERGVPQYCRHILVEGQWVDGESCPSVASA